MRLMLTCAAARPGGPADLSQDFRAGENSGNKQAKQAWKLGAALEKSEAAVYLHTFMVFMLMALMAAFRARQALDDQAAAHGEETGMERYRREVERANRNKVLVRDANHYAVLWAWEFATLAGVRLRDHGAQDVAAILKRYGVVPGGQSTSLSGDPSP